MDEVGRTHPVLTAAIKGDLEKMRQELAKAPKRINEVRRDMRLGPPLREACRRRWEPGITELMNRGAKCLGDSQCEACVRSHGGGMGVSPTGTSPTGSGTPSGTSGGYRSGTTGMGSPSGTGSTGGYRLPTTGGYPMPRPPLGTTP